MSYKNAFKCKKCPENNTENGCPCWSEIIEKNTHTNETRSNRNCVFQLLPILFTEVIRKVNRPAAEIEATRKEIIKGFENLGQIPFLPNQIDTTPIKELADAPL